MMKPLITPDAGPRPRIDSALVYLCRVLSLTCWRRRLSKQSWMRVKAAELQLDDQLLGLPLD